MHIICHNTCNEVYDIKANRLAGITAQKQYFNENNSFLEIISKWNQLAGITANVA